MDQWSKAGRATGLDGTSENPFEQVSRASPIQAASGEYRMLLSVMQGGRKHIRLAVSPNAETWEDRGPAIETGPPDSPDSAGVSAAFLFQFRPDYFRAYYSAEDGKISHVALATSTDCKRWRKWYPVVAPGGPGVPPEITRAAHASVIGDPENGYVMWYTGFPAEPANAGRIYVTFSRDGENWTDHKLTIEPGASGQHDAVSVSDPWVVRRDETLQIWYTARSADGARRIVAASSTDGINWGQSSVVAGPEATGAEAAAPAVLIDRQGNVRTWWCSPADSISDPVRDVLLAGRSS